MILKNTIARLITINGEFKDGKRTKAFQVKPGNNPSVEVPDELCENKFVKALIADGSLVVVQADPSKPDLPKPKTLSVEDESVYTELDKAQLVALCEDREIEVKSRDTAVQLIEKLEAADAAA